MPATLVLISIGGACGALARYGLSVAIPNAGGFPWATMLVNLLGCLLIGALTAWSQLRVAPVLLRPALGVGVLGGFTTFSTYAVETVELLGEGRPVIALLYVLATLLGALVGTSLGLRLMRWALGRRGPKPVLSTEEER